MEASITSHAYADHIGDWDKVAIDYGVPAVRVGILTLMLLSVKF